MRRHLFLASLSLAVACGGSTDSSDLDSGTPPNAGAGGVAGQSAGGSAGTSSAGTSSAGSGGSSAGGSGGSAQAGGGGSSGSATAGQAGSPQAGQGGSATAGQAGSPQAGSGGSAQGGEGGSGQAGSATAGQGGSGGSAGSGQAGSAGVASCAAPSDPTRAALCITFAPEEIDLVPDDPQLDGKGYMYLAAYDTPFPDNGPGEQDDAKPLAISIYPQPLGPETPAAPVALANVPTQRLDNLPTTVYLRAFFFDNLEALQKKEMAWGVWLGGLELAGGLKEGLPLNKLALPAGQGTPLLLPLTALRRLEVTVNLSKDVKPLDDASGPFRWFAFKTSTPGPKEPAFGLSLESCQSLEVEPVGPKVRGLVVGAGPYYVVGGLNDFNVQDPSNIGTIYNLEFKNGAVQIPQKDKITLPAKAYHHEHTIELGLVAPGAPNQPKPPSYTCP